jgi:hypothetical protein
MDMAMKQNVMGKDMDIKNKMLMGYTFEVNDDSAGWKKIAATISRVAMDMNAAGMTVHFDTNELIRQLFLSKIPWQWLVK